MFGKNRFLVVFDFNQLLNFRIGALKQARGLFIGCTASTSVFHHMSHAMMARPKFHKPALFEGGDRADIPRILAFIQNKEALSETKANHCFYNLGAPVTEVPSQHCFLTIC